MAAEISPELLKKCLEIMELFDVPEDTRQFCQDAMYLEFEMSSVPGDFKKTFSTHDDEDDDADGGDDDDDAKMHRLSTNFDDYSTVLQASLASFKRWTDRLKNLTDTSKLLPPLKVTEGKVKQLKAPYYLRAGEVSIQEGELIAVLDVLQDSTLKVKVGQDREGEIPILSLIMPSSDFSFTTLMERLHVVLLCAWFECFRLFYQRLFRLLLITLDVLAYTYPPNVSSHAKGPKVPKDLRVLKKIVVRLEQDCLEKKDGIVSKSDELVSKLSKAYKCYKIFEKLLKNFKVPDEADKLRPLCIFDKLSEFQSRVPKDKPIKYYKTKIVIESVETREEILHYPATDSSSTMSDSSAHQTKVESERLTSSSQEVQKRFVVKAVRDPRTGKDISLDDAIKDGVLDMNKGFYINPTTGASKPIPAAMNEGLIKVEAVTETVSKQKSEEMGILTVKSPISENREYKVIQTVDPITAEKLDPETAQKRGWLLEGGYKVENRVIPMDEAIEIGWVQVEYLSSSSESPEDSKYEARTYLIRSVRDERRNRSLGFTEAISCGLIDVDMGCYVNSQTRDKISLDEALRLGVVKGRRLREGEDPGALVSNPGNRVIAGNIGKFKTIATALTGFGVKSAYKHGEGNQ